MAVLLIFQKDGLLESTLSQLAYFKAQGYATLVVSNAPLADADLRRLMPLTFRVLERPNVGYDFGGYRDGILHLLESGIRPNTLIVLNDSVWFPACKDSDPLADIAEIPADLVGLTFYTHLRKPERNHIQSYFYRFGPRILADPFFEDYWRSVPISNARNTVIRRCEMRLTRAFEQRGFSIGVLCPDPKVGEHLATLSTDELGDVVTYISTALARHASAYAKLNHALGDKRAEQHALLALEQEDKAAIPYLYLHPHMLVGLQKTPVLKKNRDGYYVAQRKEIARLGYLRQTNEAVARELINWDS